MAITTAEAFLVVLEKSGLLNTEQFAEAQDATLLTSDAVELAEMLIRQELITPWQSTQLLAGRHSLFLGNYALMDLLGRGGMGSVFLARHRTMNRRVALKVVSKQVGKDPASLDRFLAEARLIASLDHPNIVQAYDVGKESDRFYIVMEYIEGQDLEAIVQEHGLFGFEEVADCIRQAAEGLAHAHGRNMIHCDIKPSNLLLSDQGVIKILDMGMARLAESGEDSGEQVDHKVLGTIDYMSPEQAMDGPDFDHRADIYSLGCTLYFLLTGHPPFDEGTLTQRIVKHQTQPPPDILAEQPDTPQELVDICMKMMAKDPADRYQSAEEVAVLLTGWHEPIRSNRADDTGPPHSEARPQDPHSQENGAQLQPGPASATAQSATNLAMDHLQDTAAVTAGPVLENKKKRTWSEEQQTAILVAAAVFFAIVVLSVALIAMTFRPPQTAGPTISQNDTTPDSPPSEIEDTPAPKQPSPEPDAAKTEPPSPPEQKQPPPATTPAAKSPLPTATKANPPESIIPDFLKPKPRQEDSKKPEPKPEPSDPFRELPAAVDLDLLPDTVRHPQSEPYPPFKLATLHPGVDSTLQIELVGGNSALPHGERFSLRQLENVGSELTWIVRLDYSPANEYMNAAATTPSAAQEPADVARIWFGQGALVIEWLPAAVAKTANQLKNCALDITVDGKKRTLALSRPRFVEPLTADLNTGTATRMLSSEYLPNANNLHLVVTALEGPVPGGRIEQNTVIEARNRADIDIKVQNLKRLIVRVSYDVKSGQTSATLECFYQPGGENRLVKLRNTEWKKLDNYYTDAVEKMKILKLAIANQKGRRSNTSLAQKKLETIEKRLAELEALRAFGEAVHDKGKVFFHEYIEDGGRRIEMTTTDAPPDKKEGGE